MTARLEVDDTRCIGAGNCELVAPATFRVEEALSRVVDENASDAPEIEQAIRECPTMAIRQVAA